MPGHPGHGRGGRVERPGGHVRVLGVGVRVLVQGAGLGVLAAGGEAAAGAVADGDPLAAAVALGRVGHELGREDAEVVRRGRHGARRQVVGLLVPDGPRHGAVGPGEGQVRVLAVDRRADLDVQGGPERRGLGRRVAAVRPLDVPGEDAPLVRRGAGVDALGHEDLLTGPGGRGVLLPDHPGRRGPSGLHGASVQARLVRALVRVEVQRRPVVAAKSAVDLPGPLARSGVGRKRLAKIWLTPPASSSQAVHGTAKLPPAKSMSGWVTGWFGVEVERPALQRELARGELLDQDLGRPAAGVGLDLGEPGHAGVAVALQAAEDDRGLARRLGVGVGRRAVELEGGVGRRRDGRQGDGAEGPRSQAGAAAPGRGRAGWGTWALLLRGGLR